MKNLAAYFAIALWAYVFGQACELQYQDDQAFATISHNACSLADDQPTLEQDLKLDAERLQAIDPVAAQIVLDTLRNVQQVKHEVNLGEIGIGERYYTCDTVHGGIAAPHWHIVPINQ